MGELGEQQKNRPNSTNFGDRSPKHSCTIVYSANSNPLLRARGEFLGVHSNGHDPPLVSSPYSVPSRSSSRGPGGGSG